MATQSTYAYQARDAVGAVVNGTMVAGSADEVGAQLRADGKFVLDIDDKPLRGNATLDAAQIRRNQAAKRVKRDDVIAFCQQLSVMLETGVPLAEALDAFCRQTRKDGFRQVLSVLESDIHGGETFSMAMSKWPRIFPRLMISLMKASEASGTMAMMLGRMADYLARERRTLKQIKGALAYPMFMMGVGLVLSIFLMAVVLPRFASIYEQRSAVLPAPTKFLLGMSDFVTGQFLYYGPVLAVTIVGLAFLVRMPFGRSVCDWLRLHTPVVGSMYRQMYITRATRTLATLLTAGVNLLDIIDICRGVTDNVHFNVLWTEMEDGVRAGKQISHAVNESRYIQANIASMIQSGERSGRLGQVMERISEFAEQELEGAIKQVTSFIEPVMIVMMGVVVGGIAMALLLPIFRMGSVMAGG